ncbi:class I SAM-dependent methyltransferase [Noviherbaspirillum aerium]|uniref:class I SAM-dependent methyltransferase n=1 Tax=Noviherbaspirillum aerium TaxID=2588497 RepID=UPI00124E1E8B|nr:class I SAM-dependent methyltransferase [Noviherbaspirillum aerium]
MNNLTTTESTPLSAPSLTGAAILLEIGSEYGLIDLLRQPRAVSVSEAVLHSGLAAAAVTHYCEALVSAGLLEHATPDTPSRAYRSTKAMARTIHDVGYLSWGLRACQPLIANARRFALDQREARDNYQRDGGLVARTSQWMGEQSFYPHAEEAILSLRPRHFVDLGCGSARLLVKVLQQLPEAYGTGIDISAKACADARHAAGDASLGERLRIIESPIQALADDPSPLIGADVIHAGFVLHDLMPEDEPILDRLLAACRTTAPRATLVVVDAVPFAKDERERMFSAAFSYLHHGFMGRELQSEIAWSERLARAGFGAVEIGKLGIPGGRLFLARSQ